MTAERDSRRVVLAASLAEAPMLKDLFRCPELQRWEVLDADSLERAHFVLQHDSFDALLWDESLGHHGDHELTRMLAQDATPVVLLLTPTVELLTSAVQTGAMLWLPRPLSLEHPRLIGAALDRATMRSEQSRRIKQTSEALSDCRRRVGRLLGMLWDNTPVDGRTRWYSQRHMIERLQEELARVARSGGQFSVVLGEMQPRNGAPAPNEALLSAWVSDHIHQLKRRCDVLGHYGPHGFLLVLPHTSEKGAVAFCQRLRYSLEQTPPRPPMPAAVLFGVAVCGDGRTTVNAVLRRAEEKLEEFRSAAAVGLVC